MAAPELTAWDKRSLSFIQSTTTRRTALVLADAAGVVTGTHEIGSTGRRDVSGLATMTWLDSGRFVLMRTGQRVDWFGINLLVKAGAPSSFTVFTNDRTNTGFFEPNDYAVTARAIAASGNGTSVTGPGCDVFINKDLGTTLHGATAGQTYQFHASWSVTTGWPTGLPGVADGDPIGV